MSFDLYIFDRDDVPDDEEDMGELLEDEDSWGAPVTPLLARFVAELEARYASLDEHPDDSPWASWPLSDSIANGTGLALNIAWSQAERMSREVRALAMDTGLVVYDPQDSTVVRPPGRPSTAKPKRWWRRR